MHIRCPSLFTGGRIWNISNQPATLISSLVIVRQKAKFNLDFKAIFC